LPTIAESGFPGFDGSFWYAYLVPTGTSAAIVRRLYTESAKALQLPDVQQALARQGLESTIGTPQELAARIKTESAVMGKLVKEAGIRGE
jgi:tripartite-type tricarboxylate transporter receptor subunit TctC